MSYLIDCCNFDTLHHLSFHFLSAVLVQFRVVASDLALVNLTEKPHHVRVKHRREEIRV
jgi:hypothetical protein